MPSRLLGLTLVPALVVVLAAAAHADIVTFKDGTKLEGTIVEEGADELVFEHSVGGAKVRSTFKKEDLKSIEKVFGGGAKNAKKSSTVAKEAPKPDDQAYPEAKDGAKLAMIVLDRSGSMSIAGRFAAALDEVDKILAAMDGDAKFDVYVFDRKPRSLFKNETLHPSASVRKMVREQLKTMGLNPEGFTDIVAGLKAAFERRPDTVFLISDGVATAGVNAIDRMVSTVAESARRLRAKVHAVHVYGGKYTFADIEDLDAAKRGLSAIASETGGKYRDVVVRPEAKTALKPGAKPIEDEVKFALYNRGRKFYSRELDYPKFQVEVDDPALRTGGFVLEYSVDIKLNVRVLTQTGVLFDELRGIQLNYKNGKLWTTQSIKVVRPNDLSAGNQPDGDDAGVLRVKVPTLGGIVEINYNRGGREHKYTVIVPSPRQWE